mmetsp:Transcript_3320/g.7489  ORF Transcript_3320/g.7489 Transcript_3320/m.7489 type:complete len:285 (-) Transcript_3320:136-990(-)
MRAASSEARLSCRERSTCELRYNGRRASRICTGSCSKSSDASNSAVSVITSSRSTAIFPSTVVRRKSSSSLASRQLPSTSHTSPAGESGRSDCRMGLEEMSETNFVKMSSTLSTSSDTNSANTWSATACASLVVGACPMSMAATRSSSPTRFPKYVDPFFPTVRTLHRIPIPSSSALRSSVALMTALLKPPQSPRSPVQQTSSTDLTGRASVSGMSTSSTRRRWLTPYITLTRFSEKGRPFWTAVCARRTFAAATSFMASVIFFVFLMLPMRSRRSLSDSHTTC